MARAWDAQGKSTVYVSGQAATVLGRQYACVGFLQSTSGTQSRGGNIVGGVRLKPHGEPTTKRPWDGTFNFSNGITIFETCLNTTVATIDMVVEVLFEGEC